MATATKNPETRTQAQEEPLSTPPANAELVHSPAPLELAELPSAEEIQKRAERQIKIRKAYVSLVAKELRPEDVLVFGNNTNATVYLPKKPCQDILSWARINMRMGAMNYEQIDSPDGPFRIYEITAKISDSTGREIDVVGNRSTRDDFFGSAGSTYVCPECQGPLTRKKDKPNDQWDSSFCGTHGKVKAEKVTHYLPLCDVDIASVRLSAVTNLYNHAVEAIGLMPTLKDLADAGMDISKVKRVDFKSDRNQSAGSQGQGAAADGRAAQPNASGSHQRQSPAGATGQRTAGSASAASQPQTTGTGPQTHQKQAAPPQQTGGVIKAVIEAVHIRSSSGDYLKSSKGNRFVRLIIAGQSVQLFDNMQRIVGKQMASMFELLEQAQKGWPIEYTEEVSAAGYHNIKTILRLGNWEWEEDGTPVLRRDAPMDHRMPDWEPNNPNVTDEDVPW